MTTLTLTQAITTDTNANGVLDADDTVTITVTGADLPSGANEVTVTLTVDELEDLFATDVDADAAGWTWDATAKTLTKNVTIEDGDVETTFELTPLVADKTINVDAQLVSDSTVNATQLGVTVAAATDSTAPTLALSQEVTGDTNGDGTLDANETVTIKVTGANLPSGANEVTVTLTVDALEDLFATDADALTAGWTWEATAKTLTKNVTIEDGDVETTFELTPLVADKTINVDAQLVSDSTVNATQLGVTVAAATDSTAPTLALSQEVTGDTNGDGTLDANETVTIKVTGANLPSGANEVTVTLTVDALEDLFATDADALTAGWTWEATAKTLTKNVTIEDGDVETTFELTPLVADKTINVDAQLVSDSTVNATQLGVTVAAATDSTAPTLALSQEVTGDTNGDGTLDANETVTIKVTGANLPSGANEVTVTLTVDALEDLFATDADALTAGWTWEATAKTLTKNVTIEDGDVETTFELTPLVADKTINVDAQLVSDSTVNATQLGVTVAAATDSTAPTLALSQEVTGDTNGDGTLDANETVTIKVTGANLPSGANEVTVTLTVDALEDLFATDADALTAGWTWEATAKTLTKNVTIEDGDVETTFELTPLVADKTINVDAQLVSDSTVNATQLGVTVAAATDSTAPTLALSQEVTGDTNGDGTLDANETVTIKVTGANLPSGANEVTVTLTVDALEDLFATDADALTAGWTWEATAKTLTKNVTIEDGDVETTFELTPLVADKTINVDAQLVSDSTVNATQLGVTVAAATDSTAPTLALSQEVTGDTNGDGTLDANETVTITVTGANLPDGANEVTVTLTVDALEDLFATDADAGAAGWTWDATAKTLTRTATIAAGATTATFTLTPLVADKTINVAAELANNSTVKANKLDVTVAAAADSTAPALSLTSEVTGDTNADGVLDANETVTITVTGANLPDGANEVTVTLTVDALEDLFATDADAGAAGWTWDATAKTLTRTATIAAGATTATFTLTPLVADKTINVAAELANNSTVKANKLDVTVAAAADSTAPALSLTSEVTGDTNADGVLDANETVTITVTGANLPDGANEVTVTLTVDALEDLFATDADAGAAGWTWDATAKTLTRTATIAAGATTATFTLTPLVADKTINVAAELANNSTVKASKLDVTVAGESTEPTQPTQPTEPTEPTEPTQPTEPSEPTNPSEPTQPGDAGADDKLDVIVAPAGNKIVTFAKNLSDYALEYNGTHISINAGGAVADHLVGFTKLVFKDGSIDLASHSGLFDPVFYALNNLDVFKAGVGSSVHFLRHGASEGRDPNAFFDVSGYLAVNKDVAAAGVNALEHFIQHGATEGRDTSANFDVRLYLQNNADVAAAGVNALEHYLQYGRAEGRKAYEAIGETIAADGFDAQHYLLSNADVAAAGVDARTHFAEYGFKEGRSANTLFDPADYLAANADVAAAGVDPLAHYNTYGWREGRVASSEFDANAYLAENADVAAAGINPLTHYLQYGIYEGREIHEV